MVCGGGIVKKASIGLAIIGVLLLLSGTALAQSNAIAVEISGFNRGDAGDIITVA